MTALPGHPHSVAGRAADREAPPPAGVDSGGVETLPAVIEIRPLEAEEQLETELEHRGGPAPLPAVQTAALVAGGFVAGAATVALVRYAAGRPGRREPRRPDRRRVEVVSSRSFIVDVHVIDHR